jgi:hypothetical protein
MNIWRKINPLTAISYINGRYSSNDWLTKLKTEFKIQNFEQFITNISTKFVEASKYEFSNRISDITNINYGKTKSTPIGLELSVSDVRNKCRKILLQCINYYLPQQNIQRSTTSTIENNSSVDDVETFIRQRSSDNQFDSNSPVVDVVTQKPITEQGGVVSVGGINTNTPPTTQPPSDGPVTTVTPIEDPEIILGACVLSDGNCTQLTRNECDSRGGQYLGDNTNCPPIATGGTGVGTGGGSGAVGTGGGSGAGDTVSGGDLPIEVDGVNTTIQAQ